MGLERRELNSLVLQLLTKQNETGRYHVIYFKFNQPSDCKYMSKINVYKYF